MYNTYWRCNPSGDWYEHDTDWNEQDAMEQEIIYYEQEIMNVSWEEERSKKLQRIYWQRRSKKER